MNYLDWHVGMKVVCVDARNNDGCVWARGEEPIVGEVYTLRSIHLDGDDLVVWLEEIRRSGWARREWGETVGYGIERFRPVQTRKTDISMFTSMLTDKRERVDA